MKIGIVAPIDAKSYLAYFQAESDRKILCDYSFDYTVPAVTTLTQSLLKRGHTVLIFTTSIRAFELKTKKLEIYSVKAARTPLKYIIDGFSLYREINRHLSGVDVLHAHWTYEFAMGASFFSKKIPVLCTVRDWAPYIWTVISLREKIYWASKVLINKYIQSKKEITFIGNSEYTQNLLKDKLKRNIDFIPNPISNAFILETERLNVNNNVVVLCISSSSISDKRKNVPSLLKAFQLFKMHNNGAKLVLVGDFSEKDPAMKPYRESGLLEDVEIRGKVAHDRLKEVIDEASFLVAPSIEETFGNTLIESMARKLPV
ncbi:MAG: glycosyltransferase family 4 protein, partial [Alphaproteobacteria bacterium]|nr:glycosyltransferase family 4 protein [Alphaproteobacteria bacterium]